MVWRKYNKKYDNIPTLRVKKPVTPISWNYINDCPICGAKFQHPTSMFIRFKCDNCKTNFIFDDEENVWKLMSE